MTETLGGGVFAFTAVLPAGYELDDGVELPHIQVTVAADGQKGKVKFAITEQPVDQEAAEGEDVTFSVKATGEELTYQWQLGTPGADADHTFDRDTALEDAFDWTDLEGAVEAEYNFKASLDDLFEYVYRCVVTSGEEKLVTRMVKVQEVGNQLFRSGGNIPTMNGLSIYANGTEIKIVAGTGGTQDNPYTNILYDKNGNGNIENTEYLKIGSDEPTAAGYDLSDASIYGGGGTFQKINVNPKITMTGGHVQRMYGGGTLGAVTGDTCVTVTGGIVRYSVYGGGWGAELNGNTSVTISGEANVGSVYGGGEDDIVTGNATVVINGGTVRFLVQGGGKRTDDTVGSTTLTIGGSSKIGYNTPESVYINGVYINGGAVSNGVSSFAIDPYLTGGDGCIKVWLSEGFNATGNPIIATGAIQSDLAKLRLIGPGAEGLTTYLDGTDIKVCLDYTVSVSVKEQGPYYKNGKIMLMADVKSAADQTEIKTGTVRFYKGETPLGEAVSYGTVGGSGTQKAFALAVICGTGGNLPELTAGGDNIIKAVYTPAVGREVTSKPITVTVSDKINGSKYISSETFENQTGDGVNYVSPVQFDVAGNGESVGIKASQFVISGTKGGEPFSDFQVEATERIASVKVKDPGTYVFTAKLPADGDYAAEHVSSPVTVLAPYTVTYNLKNLTVEDQPDQINHGQPLSITLSPANYHRLPDSIEVLVSGSKLTDGEDYTYNSSTGVIEIESVTGDVGIAAAAAHNVTWQTSTIYANGTPLLLAEGTTSGNTVIYIDTDDSGNISGPDTIVSFNITGINDDTPAGNDLRGYTVYGGSGQGKDYTGDTSLTMLSGEVNTLYGGGNDKNTGGKVTGDTSVTIKGGKVTDVFGGGDLSNGINVEGNTSVVIDGGEVGGIYGGGNGDGVITGDSSVTINNGTVLYGGTANMVCGGGNGKVEGTASVTITGGTVNTLVFGGGRDGAAASSRVTVTGGLIIGALYGGGLEAGTTGAASVSMTGGSLTKIAGDSHYTGRIYGGNFRSAAGSQSVTLGSDAQAEGGVAFKGNSVPNGVTSVTIDSRLTGTDPIPFVLPAGFNASQRPVIATNAAEDDLDKIELTGSGSAGLEAYLDGTDIKVQLPHTVSVSVKEEGPYYKNDKIVLVANIKDAENLTEITTGTVQFYKGETPLGEAVSYNPGGGSGERKGFALAVICGSGNGLPELTAGSDNTIKVVYTPVFGKKVTSDPVTVTVSDKINGNKYMSSTTFENETGDGVHYTAAPVQFGVDSSGGSAGVTASQYDISGTKDGEPFTDFQVEVTDDTATVKVKDPGTYVFTAKFSESSGYVGEKVSDPVIVLAPFTVTYTLENLMAEGQPKQVNYGSALSVTLSPADHYKLPDTVQVYMDGNQLVPEINYTYDRSTGVVELDHATGDVAIHASGIAKSGDAALSALTYIVNGGPATEVPGFAPGTLDYGVTLPYKTARDAVITLNGTPNDAYAAITENNGVTLVDGSGTAVIEVTAENGTTQTYSVTLQVSDVPTHSGSSGGSGGGGGGSTTGTGSPTPSTTTTTQPTDDGGSVTTTTTTTTGAGGNKTTVTTEVKKDASGNVTGSATTVTTDNITTQADQGNAAVTVSPDASAINSAVGAAGASAENPVDISVSVPQETLSNEVQKPDVNTVQVDVVLPKSVKDNPAVQNVGVTIEKEIVEAARQSGKRLEVTVREEGQHAEAVWSLDGQTMKSASGQATDLNLGVRIAPVQSSDSIANPVKPPVTAGGHENGLVISLAAEGTLLSPARLTVPATNQTGITAGSTAVLYRYDPVTGTLSPVPGGVYTVDVNGNVTIDVPAGTRTGAKETYVLLPAAAAPGTAATGTGSGTVHTIKAGDTLNQISRQYGCRVEDLLALNPGVDIYNLQVGSGLNVPIAS